MENEKYVSLNRLSNFLDKLKNMFVTKDEMETKMNEKSNISHTHDEYVNQIELDNFEFITINDVDAICGSSITYASSGVTF